MGNHISSIAADLKLSVILLTLQQALAVIHSSLRQPVDFSRFLTLPYELPTGVALTPGKQ